MMPHALEPGVVFGRKMEECEKVLVSVVRVDSFEHFAVLATPQLPCNPIIVH